MQPDPSLNSDANRASLKRSRLFIVGFVVLTLATLGFAITTNLMRLPETESAAARVQAGQKLLQSGQSAANSSPVAVKLEPLDVTTTSGKIRLQVEVMRTADEQAKGLMFRQSMPQDNGMLFDFGLDRPASMWMRNTYIPLDMVFVKADGTVHRIEERTEPLSERTIASGTSVRAVLELNAGTSQRLGLKPGDKLAHPIFGK